MGVQEEFVLRLVCIIVLVQFQPIRSANPEVVFQWNIIEYEWPNVSMKNDAIASGSYLPENSAVNGIKLYKGKVYVTVPRLKGGVPSTLNEIVENTSPEMTSVSHVLRPYPSWDMQTLENCDKLQIVQSMEIDPATGYMWIIDTGYKSRKDVNVQPLEVCPPKLVIYDIDNDVEVHRYTFPKSTVGEGLFYLNDIVLEYYNGSARYAYISETLGYKLVVYDYLQNRSWSYCHSSMEAVPQHTNFTISGIPLTGIITGINGIGMSPDFKYLYYSSVAGVGMYQIETSVLKSANGSAALFAAAVRSVGNKVSPGDGMSYGARENLYYSALTTNAVYVWNIAKDLEGKDNANNVRMVSHKPLVSDPRMDWIDTLALDDDGYLWFTTSRLNKFFSKDGIVRNESNFYVWKVYVNDFSYMKGRMDSVTLGAGAINVSMTVIVLSFVVYILS